MRIRSCKRAAGSPLLSSASLARGAAAEYRFAWTDPLSIFRESAGFYTYLVNVN
jgi:hypothetical protein